TPGASMARMIPTTPPTFHGSQGEERVFRALRTLPDEVVVIHSLRWLHPGNVRALTSQLGAQGEGDFVLFDPALGIMGVEVTGGDVWCEHGEWRQRNRRTGNTETIWPEVQASDTAHRIRHEVTEKAPEARGFRHRCRMPTQIEYSRRYWRVRDGGFDAVFGFV